MQQEGIRQAEKVYDIPPTLSKEQLDRLSYLKTCRVEAVKQKKTALHNFLQCTKDERKVRTQFVVAVWTTIISDLDFQIRKITEPLRKTKIYTTKSEDLALMTEGV